MWKHVNGELIHTTDTSRVKFRTNISAELLDELKTMASNHHTHVNYLLENGLTNLIATKSIQFNKKNRPKDRVQYKTTYNKELLGDVKEFAKKHGLFANDVIEHSMYFIDVDTVKDKDYKHRVK